MLSLPPLAIHRIRFLSWLKTRFVHFMPTIAFYSTMWRLLFTGTQAIISIRRLSDEEYIDYVASIGVIQVRSRINEMGIILFISRP